MLDVLSVLAVSSTIRIPNDSVVLGLPLARGSFGTVLTANLNGKQCIAKRCIAHKVNAAAYLDVEASINEKLHLAYPGNRHLAPYIGVCSVGRTDHLVWEACPGIGHSLEWYLCDNGIRQLAIDLGVAPSAADGAFDSERLSYVLLQEMLSALALLHSHGIIHRDLKPENWLVDKATRSLRLIDFGSAYDMASTTSQIHSMPTTMAYAPPELRLMPDRPWAFDIYSVALICVRCAMAASKSQFDTIRDKLGDGWRPWESDLQSVGQVQPVLDRLLATDPQRRVPAEEALCSAFDMCAL